MIWTLFLYISDEGIFSTRFQKMTVSDFQNFPTESIMQPPYLNSVISLLCACLAAMMSSISSHELIVVFG